MKKEMKKQEHSSLRKRWPWGIISDTTIKRNCVAC